ncbi:hypothetical protein BN1723_011967 [Verticillium longisporum]|uniref:Uncharacterized protein n=1 Tax=Verticillium longisporum TaxID=100787 RepID=A0A0G4LCR6_VERLO|nr:hypothetical protein BN1723_011967 [Verticillium longisporum]
MAAANARITADTLALTMPAALPSPSPSPSPPASESFPLPSFPPDSPDSSSMVPARRQRRPVSDEVDSFVEPALVQSQYGCIGRGNDKRTKTGRRSRVRKPPAADILQSRTAFVVACRFLNRPAALVAQEVAAVDIVTVTGGVGSEASENGNTDIFRVELGALGALQGENRQLGDGILADIIAGLRGTGEGDVGGESEVDGPDIGAVAEAEVACLWGSFLTVNVLAGWCVGREAAGAFALRVTDDDAFETKDARRLYLYSKEDDLITSDDVEMYMAESRQKGYQLRAELFDGSGHVGHMRMHPEKYWKAIADAWAWANEEPKRG